LLALRNKVIPKQGGGEKMKITKDMVIAQILDIDRGLAGVLLSHGLRCVG